MRIIALAGVQNGLVLAGCLVPVAAVFPVACLVLPLPLAASLLPAMKHRGPSAPRWLGWIDLALSLAVFAGTLVVPLDSLAAVFAPLLGLDGVIRSVSRRRRTGLSLAGRGLALLQGVLLVLAVSTPDLTIAWLGVLAAMTASLLPTLMRRRDDAILAFLGAGLALFGLLLLPVAPPILAYFCLFAGFATIAAVIPDLAAVLVILLLRLASRTPWPPEAEVLGTGVALTGLLACAILLVGHGRSHRATLLYLSQCGIAALSLGTGQPDGRFAALILLMLLILCRSAARVPDRRVTALAIAGLGGASPVGVFPGLAIVILAVTGHHGWLLLPLGAAAIPMVMVSLPRQLPGFPTAAAIPSVGWLPLALALLAGYFAPNGLTTWWHIMTAGHS